MNITEMDKNAVEKKIKKLKPLKKVIGALCSVSMVLVLPVFFITFPNPVLLIGYIVLVAVIIGALILSNNRLADKIKRLEDYQKTGVITEPEKMNRDMLIHKVSIGAFVAGILGFFLTFFIAFSSSWLWPIVLVISIGLCAAGFIIGFKAQGRIESTLEDDLAKKVQPRLAGVITPGAFDSAAWVNNSAVSAERITGSCYTEGKYNGYDVKFSNLQLAHYEYRDGERCPVTDFNGICIVISDSHPINENTPQRVTERLTEEEVYDVSLSEPDTLVILIRSTYYLVTQYGPDRVKPDSEIDADIKKLSRILYGIEQAVREAD